MFQGTQKSQFYFQQMPLSWSYSEKCAKINILHVLNQKSITTWVSEIPVQLLGSLECYLYKKHILLATNVL